ARSRSSSLYFFGAGMLCILPEIRACTEPGAHQIAPRYERKAEHFLAFLILGASLTCYKNLRKLAT
ncbi:hypothetical protein AB0M56_46570, partial [Amycolatopsis sp. NPDC051372]